MELSVLIFLTSGLFLGWSLGANDAANVFGTAVGTRMIGFATAAVICSVFVIVGALISGSGAARTLGSLGSVNALAGAFMVALAAAYTVYAMTKLGMPVSTTQAIVGAIVGWNLFSESITDTGTLTTIVMTWVACPLLAALIAMPTFKLAELAVYRFRLHLLRQDAYTRTALILAGAFGAYSLGANNIANVVGVFIPVSPFTDFGIAGVFTVSSTEQLFLIGAIAIAIGIFTYSKKVMLTVGKDLLPLSPVAAWVAVVSHSIVLMLFASEGLEHLLARAGLPTIPLVPVSSSQAIVGAVLGIGLLRGGREIRWRVLGNIGLAWVSTPIVAGVLCLVSLFFLQNVFNQQVYRPVIYSLSAEVMGKLAASGIPAERLADLDGKTFPTAAQFLRAVRQHVDLDGTQKRQALWYAETRLYGIASPKIEKLSDGWLTAGQLEALRGLSGIAFTHKWQIAEALAARSAEWKLRPDTKVNKLYNNDIREKLDAVYRTFTEE